MTQDDPLLLETRARFQSISARLDQKRNELQSRGLLTELDMQKMMNSALQSGEAVLVALDRTDYPPEMQRELINRLILQFENSTNEVLAKAEQRLYNNKYIEIQLNEIDNRVISEFGELTKQWADTNSRFFSAAHEDFKQQLRQLIHDNTYTDFEIESLFRKYEEQLIIQLKELLPKIEKDIWQESAHGKTEPRTGTDAVYEHKPQQSVKQENTRPKRNLRKFIKSLFTQQGERDHEQPN